MLLAASDAAPGVLAHMSEGTLLTYILAYSCFLGGVTALFARARGRHWLVWFFLGIILNPLIAVPLLFIFRRGDAISRKDSAPN